jgi:hypothetical protein
MELMLCARTAAAAAAAAALLQVVLGWCWVGDNGKLLAGGVVCGSTALE